MAGKNGGYRPGSGPKKGSKLPKTLEKEAAREYVRQQVMLHIEPLIAAQVANAQGLKYLVIRDAKTGKFTRVTEARMNELLDSGGDDLERVEVWEKDPSVQAFSDLLNRALDKPKEQEQEVRHSGGILIAHELPAEVPGVVLDEAVPATVAKVTH